FRDELGDWRVCVLTPFGGRVHAPWAIAIEAKLQSRLSVEVQTMWSDEGIVVRLPEADDAPPVESVLLEPEEVEDLVVSQLANTALFAGRFRENAARALLLPRRRPGSRTPLWQQRERAADLRAVASKHGSFPILLETYRECLRDAFDVPALVELMTNVRSRQLRVVSVDTGRPSPFATSLAFAYVANFLSEGDAPLAERKAQALTLDRDLLAERLIAAEDAGRYRDALGAGLPAGLPDVFLEPADDPLGSLLGRWARTHPPFTSGEPAARFGLPVALVEDLLARRADSGLLLRGEFRPDGSEREWCDPQGLRQLG